jgi:hypothetical protein
LQDSNGEDIPEKILLNAVGYEYMEVFGNGTTKIFYRNGSVALFNQTGFVRFVIAPTSFFV